jgi:hypothetical protein
VISWGGVVDGGGFISGSWVIRGGVGFVSGSWVVRCWGGFVVNGFGSGFVSWGRGGFVSGFGSGFVGGFFGVGSFAFVFDISDETVFVGFVCHDLNTAIGKVDTVFTTSIVVVSVFGM